MGLGTLRSPAIVGCGILRGGACLDEFFVAPTKPLVRGEIDGIAICSNNGCRVILHTLFYLGVRKMAVSFSQCVARAWNLIKKYPGIFIGGALAMWLTEVLLPEFLQGVRNLWPAAVFSQPFTWDFVPYYLGGILLFIAYLLLDILIGLIYTRFCLAGVRGGVPRANEVISELPTTFLRSLRLGGFYLVIMAIPFVSVAGIVKLYQYAVRIFPLEIINKLVLIFGILSFFTFILAVPYLIFSSFFLRIAYVDQNCSALRAFFLSLQRTYGKVGKLLLLCLFAFALWGISLLELRSIEEFIGALGITSIFYALIYGFIVFVIAFAMSIFTAIFHLVVVELYLAQ